MSDDTEMCRGRSGFIYLYLNWLEVKSEKWYNIKLEQAVYFAPCFEDIKAVVPMYHCLSMSWFYFASKSLFFIRSRLRFSFSVLPKSLMIFFMVSALQYIFNLSLVRVIAV